MSCNDKTPSPPCEAPTNEPYSVAWHATALFLVLSSSLLGTMLPILGKRASAFRVPEFAYAIGKSLATGVILGVALIHMLKPANDSLTSECMPSAIRNLSNPLAYIICLASLAALHSLEACLRAYFDSCGIHLVSPVTSGERKHLLADSQAGGSYFHSSVSAFDDPEVSGDLHILSAVLLECGVSLHSLFVGLTVGVCADAELFTLMCALSLHQFFEGIALGSRLVDAALRPRTEHVFAAVFVLSAPFGTFLGVLCVYEGVINTKGGSYLLMQGILDSVCAGILLYVAFQLLVSDFYSDMRSSIHSVRSPRWFLLSMLGALWAGVGIMTLIGRYL
ncbi:hypothetical protein LSCM1_02835 [Leishmania martiniquensis]|uniref:Uncharacterized protein n=1 Tax=Leishmania martiniquensis TaxID=1580590 RepID=A0A836H421_9TRYP|nr:hypothetical protein LSCM1_02835 [Leishmania martiniquensis]